MQLQQLERRQRTQQLRAVQAGQQGADQEGFAGIVGSSAIVFVGDVGAVLRGRKLCGEGGHGEVTWKAARGMGEPELGKSTARGRHHGNQPPRVLALALACKRVTTCPLVIAAAARSGPGRPPATAQGAAAATAAVPIKLQQPLAGCRLLGTKAGAVAVIVVVDTSATVAHPTGGGSGGVTDEQ